MSTYYDFLGVSPTATQSEINSALDEQYNHWRRLTTHHDQEKVEEATQSLRILEQVRATLTDPANREKYNVSNSLVSQVGGLIDPSVSPVAQKIQFAAGVPLTPHSSQQRTDAWECSHCQTANSIGMRHCKNCGLAIGIDCPNCNRLTEAATKYCSNCGENIQDTIRKKKSLEEEKQRQREVQEAERIRLQREQERFRAEQTSKNLVKQNQNRVRSNIIIILLLVIVALVVLCFLVILTWAVVVRARLR